MNPNKQQTPAGDDNSRNVKGGMNRGTGRDQRPKDPRDPARADGETDEILEDQEDTEDSRQDPQQ